MLPMRAAVSKPSPPDQAPVIDCHVHCFDGDASRQFPYHERAPYRPIRPIAPELILRMMDATKVQRAVIVHPEPYQDDHRYLQHCLAVGRGRFKGTCLFFADRSNWQKEMPGLVKQGGIVALRIHAYLADRQPPFGKPELRALWKTAADLGLAVQLHFEPRYAPGFEPLIKAFARTPVLIDHLGRPLQGTPEEHAIVLRWARLPNTYLKLSAVPPPSEYPHRDIRPVMRELVAAYGPDRMVTGTFGASGGTIESYRAGQERMRSYVAHLPPAAQTAIFGGTATRLFWS